MVDSPAISVLVIAGTTRPYLGLALRSLQVSSLTDWEAIVIVSQQTQEAVAATEDIVRATHDDRIRCVSYTQHTGYPPYASRKWNFGLSLCRTPLVCFLDDDDEKAPDWMEKMVRPLQSDNALMVTLSRSRCMNAQSQDVGPMFGHPSFDRDYLLKPNFILMCQIITRTELLRSLGGFDENLACAEDWDMSLRLSSYSWKYIEDTVSYKRDHVDNACYHADVGGWTQDALRKTIRKHRLAPDLCFFCGKEFQQEEPFVRAVDGLGFRLHHYGCAREHQVQTWGAV